MIAGLDSPDAGRILLDGSDLVPRTAHRRPVNTVFQTYALFPSSRPRQRRLRPALPARARTEVAARVGAALDLVQMGRLASASRTSSPAASSSASRWPARWSWTDGAAARRADGALDAKLRKQLQVELRSLQQPLGTTFVFVTHDQEEALTMSDRLAVLDKGKVKQIGTPSEVYSSPATPMSRRSSAPPTSGRRP